MTLNEVRRLVFSPPLRRVGFGMAMTALAACGSKEAADERLEALCRVDGGITVHETVTLPADRFDEWGMPKGEIWQTSNDSSGGSQAEYVLAWDSKVIERGEPSRGELQVKKLVQTIRRKADGKLLAESRSYIRVGSDSIFSRLLGSHPSGKSCPDQTSSLPARVFIRGG